MDGAILCKRILRDERKASGLPVAIVRAHVARRIGVAPGTLENLERGRLKDRSSLVTSRLCKFLVEKLERKMAAIEQEISIARRLGELDCSPDIARAENALAAARAYLEGKEP